MRTEIRNYIGKPIFIQKYPLFFSLFVLIGTELTLLAIGQNENLKNIDAYPLRAVGIIALKLGIILSLTYGYIYFKRKSPKDFN